MVARRFVGQVALVGVVAALGAATASGDTGAPASTGIPILTGSPGVGKTLSTTDGSWSTFATFTYQWLRCNALFTLCTSIPGATAASYTIVAADVGHVLAADVTATNAAGSATARSSGKGPAEAKPPGPKHKPWIRGETRVGRFLFETGATWTRAPYVFKERWLRCSANGSTCVRITAAHLQCASGACMRVNAGVQPVYKLTKRDVGHRLRVAVTASNGAGHTTVVSDPTRIIRK
jgi:hypothetical protein